MDCRLEAKKSTYGTAPANRLKLLYLSACCAWTAEGNKNVTRKITVRRGRNIIDCHFSFYLFPANPGNWFRTIRFVVNYVLSTVLLHLRLNFQKAIPERSGPNFDLGILLRRLRDCWEWAFTYGGAERTRTAASRFCRPLPSPLGYGASLLKTNE